MHVAFTFADRHLFYAFGRPKKWFAGIVLDEVGNSNCSWVLKSFVKIFPQ